MPPLRVTDPSDVMHASAVLDTPADFLEQLWTPRFPSAELVDQAAALLPRITHDQVLTEGPRPFVRIGPGVIEVRAKDYARADRAAERALHAHGLAVAELAAYLEEHGELPDAPEPVRAITEWSRKSRANMVRTLGLLDFAPMYTDRSRLPAMVTLTYPGDWLTVAPTGKAVKAHLKAFRKRYERTWDEPLRCVWKLEFQRRGAPHIHMLMVPPHGLTAARESFGVWLSQTWAAIVAHPDPEQYRRHVLAGTGVDFAEGLRATDPKRVAVYFTKHGLFAAKEYQHIVPPEWSEPGATPGRFWGYWGLQKATAVVELDQADGVLAGRTLRRWARAQRVTHEVTVWRTPGGRALSEQPEVIGLAGAMLLAGQQRSRRRKVRRRARRMSANRGFVMVNNGAEMASQLARYLDQARPTTPAGAS